MPETTQVFRIVIRGSVEDVWQEITKTDEPIACFFNSRMDVAALRAGSKLAMRVGTKSAKQMVQGGSMIVNTLKAVIETGRPKPGDASSVRSVSGDAAVHTEQVSDGALAGGVSLEMKVTWSGRRLQGV